MKKTVHNETTKQTLEDYLGFSELHFAILIKGSWGCGKTHFIKDFIENYPKENTIFCYISLFGVATVEEFNKIVISELLPQLSGKFKPITNVVGKIASCCDLNLPWLSIDQNGICHNVLDFLEKRIEEKEIVFVFDDFERCNIQPDLLFGCINSFVTKDHSKVIIICNEDSYSENKDAGKFELYERYKEKIIGITLSIEPDLTPVLEYSIEKIKTIKAADKIKKFLQSNSGIVAEIFSELKSHNLRNIERIIVEFSRVMAKCSEEAQDNINFMRDVLAYISVHSISLADKKLSVDDMSSISRISAYARSEQHPYDSIPYLKKINMEAEDFWLSFFKDGTLTDELMEYYNSRFRISEQPIPIQLWSYYDLDDEKFKNLILSMNKEIQERKYTNPGVILHAFSIKLALSKDKLIDESLQDIAREARNYLLDITIDFNVESYSGLDLHSANSKFYSYAGLAFQAKDTKEFQDIIDAVKERRKEWSKDKIKRQINTIFQNIEEANQDYDRGLYKLRHALLMSGLLTQLVSPARFVNLLVNIHASKRRDVYDDFKELLEVSREDSPEGAKIVILWLVEMKKQLDSQIEDMSEYPLKALVLRNIAVQVDNEIQKLKQVNREI